MEIPYRKNGSNLSIRQKIFAGNLPLVVDGGGVIGSTGKKKLRDLLNLPDDTDIEIQRRDSMAVVKLLRCEAMEVRKKGVLIVRKLAKEDDGARVELAVAGAIPPMVAMIGAGVDDEAVLNAVLNLGIQNDANGIEIVESGAVEKMLKLINYKEEIVSSSITEAILANLVSLSAIDSNKPVVGASGAIKFLVEMMKNKDRFKKSKHIIIKDAISALYNLSIWKSNINHILQTEAIPVLLKTLKIDTDLSSRTLSILSNIASSNEGTEAIGDHPEVYPIIIEVLRWNERQECQEKAAYILMIMANKSIEYRKSMADSGAVSALLEVTLLGSALAQKRSSRLLEILTEKKKIKMKKMIRSGNGVSEAWNSSSCSSSCSSSSGYEGIMVEEESKERKEVRRLVRESLEKNMRRMLERADINFTPSDLIWRAGISSNSSYDNRRPF